MSYILFALTLLGISVYSWGYVDANMPFLHPFVLSGAANGLWYAGVVVILFAWYAFFWRGVCNKTIRARELVRYGGILIAALFLSFPAFSNDIFNYIATARVTYLYHENPYIVMPIDIPNEPMLHFLQAANKTALYGPTWILMTAAPHVLGFGNLLVTMYLFKLVAVFWYLVLLLIIWKLTKRLFAVFFFAFNPLVIIDTLIDAHNDVMMMALALLSFYTLKNKRFILSFILLFLSFFVKGATLFLLPVFCYAWWQQKHGSAPWQRVWWWAAVSMFVIFLLSPLREEIYSWYFIWVLSFVTLRETMDAATWVALGFTFGLPLRFLPFAATRSWVGETPVIKKLVTFVPPLIAGFGASVRERS